MSGNGQSWSFTYDANGMRTQRRNANGGYTYTYIYNGSQLSRMTYGSNTMWFTYGADGSPLTINLNGTTYYYVTNLQGDVVAILNSSGTAVVSYTYDAWSRLLTTTGSMANTLGLHNPLRYRGYVYDRETGLYYLQSRYYNPTWGRFINASGTVGTGSDLLSYNMYVYRCNYIVAPVVSGTTRSVSGGLAEMTFPQITDQSEQCTNIPSAHANSIAVNNVKENLITKGYALYKGVPVFSADWIGTSAFSFGIIVIGSKYLGRGDFAETLNHEYGHFRHFTMIGPIDYFFTTAIPSLTFAGLSSAKLFPHEYYNDLPWERTADYLGDVENDYLPTTNTSASLFWLCTLLIAGTTAC